MNTATILTAPFRRRTPLILAGCIAALLGAPTAQAASSSWNVNADGTWVTVGNWTAGVPGIASGTTSTDIATFDFALTAARIVTIDANRNIGGIIFGNTSAFGYTFTGGSTVPLRLSNGGVIENLAATGAHTDAVAVPVIIQGDNGSATFTANASSASSVLTVGAVSSNLISGVSTAGNITTLTLNGSNTNVGNTAGILTNGTAGGKLALIKDGAGTWTVGFASNASTFTGGVTINAGTLRTAGTTAGQALGAANAVTLANTAGAILDINLASQTIGSLIGGGTTGGNVTLGSSTLTTGLDNANSSYAGAISGTGGFTKTGTGTQSLTGTNTYAGGTRVNGGTLALDFSAAAAPASNIVSSSSALTLAGGTLALTGKESTTNSQTFASTTLTAGNSSALNLTANATANPLVLTIGSITRGAGTTLDLILPTGAQDATNGIRTGSSSTSNGVFVNGSIASTTVGGATWAGRTGSGVQNLVAFTDAGGSYSIGNANYTSTRNVDVTDGDAPTTDFTVNTLRFNGNHTLTLDGTTNVVSTGGILVTSAATTGATITGGTLRSSGTADALQFINNGTQLTVDSIIANNGADPTVVTLAGPGTTILNGANTYTGATYITGGTVKAGNASAIGVASAVTIADKAGAVLDLNGFDLTVASLAGGGGQGTSGQATVGTSGGTVALGSRTMTVGDASSTAFGGTIMGTGGSLVKVGTGALTLNGANTFTGGTTVKAGILVVAGTVGNNALGAGAITLGDSSGGSASATLRVGSTLGIVGTYVYNNPIVVAPNTTGLLDINSSSSAGSMTFTGGVTGANNFRINTTATGGGTLTFSTLPINNAGTLTVGGTTTNTNVTISGGIGSNVTDVILTRNNATAANGINISTGAVNNTGTITNNGTTTPTVTISAPIGINVAGIIQSSATSPLVLSGANTFRAPITVSAGTLTLGTSSQAAGINSAVTLANVAGTTLVITTTTQTLGSLAGGGATGGNVNLNNAAASTLTVGSDHTSTTYAGSIGGASPTIGLRKIGAGTLTLTRASTYNGVTAAVNGNLVLDYASADPQGANALTLGGGQLTFKGNAAGTTTDTVGAVTMVTNSRNVIAVQSNAVITTGAWTSGGSSNSVLVDISSGATSTLKTTSALATVDSASAAAVELNDIVMLGTSAVGSKRANVYVQDATGIGFATQNGANEIIRYTGATALVPGADEGTATTNTTNYKLNANFSRTAALNFQTLDIDTSGGAVTLDMGANELSATGSGRGILVTGDNDAAITSTSGTIASSDFLTVANYGGGATTLGMTMVSSGLVKNGSGLVVYSGNAMTGDTVVGEGTLRFAAAMNYSTNVVRIYGGGVFEIGADLNDATAGDFTKALGNSGNAVALLGDGGFSAHGADRTVNIGGAAAALTWGAANFLSDPNVTTDNDSILKLGSATSTNTLELVNPIALGVRQRFVETADGASATNVDGKLSGVLSGTGGLTKTGAGVLELTATNTYTGPTNVTDGTLLVSGSISGSTTTVSGTGTLGGGTTAVPGVTGAVKVNAGGALAPGASIGTLNTGAVNLASGATFQLEINTTATTTDLVAITGNLSLADADDAVLTISDLGAAPITSGAFVFITYTGAWDGDFFTSGGNMIADGGLLAVGLNQFTLDYNYNGNSVALLAIPEPGSAASLLGGLGVLLGLQRFRRRGAFERGILRPISL